MDEKRPAVPTVATVQFSEQYVEAHFYSHMSETQANAMRETSKNTHVIPARHETYRVYGPLILVAILLYFLVPSFLAAHPDPKTLAIVIVAVVAVVGAGPAVKAIIEAIKGS
jgi:hypothetical protein